MSGKLIDDYGAFAGYLILAKLPHAAWSGFPPCSARLIVMAGEKN
jgi:hypothetical protein